MNHRWLKLKTGRVMHLVDEERTGWAQIEVAGEVVFRCGKYGNEANRDDDILRRCRACAIWEGQ